MDGTKQVAGELSGVLAHIGLTQTEAEIFTELLQTSGAMRVSALAKKAKLNRTTLYGALKSLSQQGLVSSAEKGGTLVYRSVEPDMLAEHVERMRNRLSVDLEKIQKMEGALTAARARSLRPVPVVQFFEGAAGIKQIYKDTLDHNKNKKIYGFLGVDAALGMMGHEWANEYISTRVKRGVKAFTIALEGKESQDYKGQDSTQLRETKILPKKYSFEIELMVYDDKTVLVSFADDHPLAILIEDAKISELMRVLFTFINDALPS